MWGPVTEGKLLSKKDKVLLRKSLREDSLGSSHPVDIMLEADRLESSSAEKDLGVLLQRGQAAEHGPSMQPCGKGQQPPGLR